MFVAVALSALTVFIALPRVSALAKTEQRLVCRKNESVSNIEWTEVAKNYFKYDIQCEPKKKCRPKCTWTLDCNTKKYGEGCYVRGIKALYDHFKEYQSVQFLCCKNKNNTEDKCETKFKRLDGKPHPKEKGLIRQAHSNYRNPNPVLIYVEKCEFEMKNQSCRRQSHSSQQSNENSKETQDSQNDDYPTDMEGLAGLAGLSGLAGLALVKKPAPASASSASRPSQTCCCSQVGPCAAPCSNVACPAPVVCLVTDLCKTY